ncbi:MAG: outer membrane beta-barrel protein [Bacteroidales bacterium]|jgi:hypothetical protein
MKRILITILLVLESMAVINAQFTKIGGGVAYTTGFHFNNEKPIQEADLFKSPVLGLFITGIYEIKLPIRIAPSFTYFIPRTNTVTIPPNTEKTRVPSMMFDLNGHFVFSSPDRFEFYGLAGIDILFTSLKSAGTSPREHDNALGLNLGVGSYMKIAQQFDLFLEAKYLVSRYGQFMANAGILVSIQYITKHKKEPI